MSGDAWPVGVGREALESVDSTNAEAMRRAPDSDIPLWIAAREQTAGRGRQGRPWAGGHGDFAASLLLPGAFLPPRPALLSFVAALAVAETCLALGCDAGDPGLKWPNDVLLCGGKFAGILLEAAGGGRRPSYLVLGIGANLVSTPPAEALPERSLPAVSLLSATGIRATPEAFLDRLAPAFARRQAELEQRGFAPIRAAWLARAARLGSEITARTGRRDRRGRFETVDETGALVLETSAGRQAIPAAEVFF